MSRTFVVLSVVLLAAGGVPDAAAQKAAKPAMTWKGSVANEQAAQPAVITSSKGLEAVWKEWTVAGDVPKVDFAKEIVVGVYSRGSQLTMNDPWLDDQGNLEVQGFGTRDLRPGFRYVLAAVSRVGVKTVNGKELPKE